ncbi:MAG TPA: site-2 protease family protein [Bryobacteraceae bacterium]|nr:site-2 protease family protein [Bryobacteraceae bacterium]
MQARAFRIFGVPIRLHFTFILLFIFLVTIGVTGDQSALSNVLYMGGLFLSVLLHELGHVAVSKQYGIRTLEIVMYPIGGVARLERTPKPAEEFWIALAGPAVNLLIAAALLGYLTLSGRLLPAEALAVPTNANLMQRIGLGNLLLSAFNLVPAFPMDGGRILRAVLARFKSETEATRIAASAGQFLAIGIGMYGLLNAHFLLVFIAFFVYLGAAQENAITTGRILTHGVPVRAAMVTDFRMLPHGSTLRDAADLLIATSQQDFPVVLGEQVIGLLGRTALLRGMATEGPDSFIAGIMDRNFTTVSPEDDLAEAIPMLANAGTCALVMENEKLVGLLTTENLSEFLILRRFGLQPAGAR